MDEQRLLELLAEYAYQYKPGGFVLTSGQVSDEYLDCKRALSLPYVVYLAGKLVLAALGSSIQAVGGLTMGADPLAVAAAIESVISSHPVPWFSIRKQPKGHGTQRRVEGCDLTGRTVAILDDVATTGGSTIEAIRAARAEGAWVAKVVVLVDREQGGLDNIRKEAGENIPVVALFTRSAIREEWHRQQDRQVSSASKGADPKQTAGE